MIDILIALFMIAVFMLFTICMYSVVHELEKEHGDYERQKRIQGRDTDSN